MVGNRPRIIGSEWVLGFGQVAALVMIVTLCYAIFLSYQGQSIGFFVSLSLVSHAVNKDYSLKQKEKHLPVSIRTDGARNDGEIAFMAL
jgi:multisubunit Na+/H+ antiporter MnhC subunit